MLSFKEWLKNENMWGDIPSKQRKPSDGWRGNANAAPGPGGPQGAAPPMQAKMKKKMKK